MTAQQNHGGVPVSRSLRIAVFAPFPPLLGGMAELAKLVAAGLESDGHKIRRVDLGSGRKRICLLPLLYLRMAAAAFSSDIVQIISGSSAALLGKTLPGVLLARLLRRTVILNFVGGAAIHSARDWGWWRRLPFRLAHRVAVPTELFRSALERAHLRANLVVIPHVVEINPFLALPEDPQAAKPILLAAKGLSSYAGMDLLIRAMSAVRRRFPDCELWIAGDGPARSGLEALARTEAPGAIRFLGPVSHDRMPELMAQATLFVHGTRYESFGLALVEAMAAGRPVVAFSVGGIPDVVLDGRTGFLVPYGEIEALAGRVISLLGDSDQRRSMAEQARAWSRRFAWDEIRIHWHALHQATTTNKKQPRMTGASQFGARSGTGLLWIGNQVSGTRGTKGPSEHIIELLRARGWTVYAASAYENRLHRLADMLTCAFKHRQQYAIGVVDVYSGLAFRYAEIVCRFLCLMRKSVVLALHGGGLLDFARDHPARLRRFLQRGHCVVAPSHYLRHGLSGLGSNIIYLPNGLDCNQFAYRPRTRVEPRLCWVRAFSKVYNPVMAVECLASLRADFPGTRLRMVGPDSNDGTLALVRERARDLGISHALEVVGSMPNTEIPDALQQGDIFLNTTIHESFGVSVMEAAACGLCIVSTNVGELPLLWQDGHDALLVQPDDAKAMAAAVRRILLEPGLAECLSRNARAKAEQFDWSTVLPQWLALIPGIGNGLKTKPMPACSSGVPSPQHE